jgi:pimeloyl-ACP methyl ester carboxylesterase
VATAQLARLEADLKAGRPDRMLDRFLRAEVGFDEAGLDAYHANPVWPDRVAAAERTLLRELRAETTPPAGLAALGRVAQPVLLVLGSESVEWFHKGTRRLATRLEDVRVGEIPGAAHAAHHTHAAEFVGMVRTFLGG